MRRVALAALLTVMTASIWAEQIAVRYPERDAHSIVTLLKNVVRERPFKTVSWIAATEKPRRVKLETKSATAETLNGRTVTRCVLHVDIGGMSGFLAPMVGKQPPDVHVWIEEGTVPTLVRSEQPLYVDGPVWRIDVKE